MYFQELNHIHGKSMDNYIENIRPGWNYAQARLVDNLDLSPVVTQVLHASCMWKKLTVYNKGKGGLVGAIHLQLVPDANRENVIAAIHQLDELGFISIDSFPGPVVSKDCITYFLTVNIRKIIDRYDEITDEKFYSKLF